MNFLTRIAQIWGKEKPEKPAQEPISLFCEIERTVGNLVYRTANSTILASEKEILDCNNEEYLMKTPGGRYFLQTHWLYPLSGKSDIILPYTKQEAMSTYNHMPDKRVSFFEAFGEELIDA